MADGNALPSKLFWSVVKLDSVLEDEKKCELNRFQCEYFNDQLWQMAEYQRPWIECKSVELTQVKGFCNDEIFVLSAGKIGLFKNRTIFEFVAFEEETATIVSLQIVDTSRPLSRLFVLNAAARYAIFRNRNEI